MLECAGVTVPYRYCRIGGSALVEPHWLLKKTSAGSEEDLFVYFVCCLLWCFDSCFFFFLFFLGGVFFLLSLFPTEGGLVLCKERVESGVAARVIACDGTFVVGGLLLHGLAKRDVG